MKKIMLLAAALWVVIPSFSQSQNLGIYATDPEEALQIGTYRNIGNYKILIPGVYNIEQMRLGQFGNGNTGIEMINHSSLTQSYGIKLTTNIDQATGFQIQYAAPASVYSSLQYVTGFYMNINGNIGIGTTSPGDYKLAVKGTLGATRVKVIAAPGWPDFVFQPGYHLPALHELETYISNNRHLPGIPTASEVEKEGVDLGEMNKSLLQKVEELTLYLISENKRNNQLQQEVAQLKQAISALQHKQP